MTTEVILFIAAFFILIFFLTKWFLIKYDQSRGGDKTRLDPNPVTERYAHYSIQRIDLLLISISGAGVYAGWDVFKYVHEHNIVVSFSLLKWSAGLFLVTIIINFFSQFTSFHTNNNYETLTMQELGFWNFTIDCMNKGCALTMITGLYLLAKFLMVYL